MRESRDIRETQPIPRSSTAHPARAAGQAWRAPPWHAAVLYRVEAGGPGTGGGIASVQERLEELGQLGVTVLELAGLDAAALDDPASCRELARLCAAAHERGLALTIALAADLTSARQARVAIKRTLHALEDCGLDGLRLEGGLLHHGTRAARVRAAIAASIRRGCGRERHVYLTLGAPPDGARAMASGIPAGFDARWHAAAQDALRAILTASSAGTAPGSIPAQARLCRALARGVEPSLRATTAILGLQSPAAADGTASRLGAPAVAPAALSAARALLLLAPAPPQLLLGEEWDAPPSVAGLLDRRCGLSGQQAPYHAQMLDQCRRLLAVRRRDLVPLLPAVLQGTCARLPEGGAFAVEWRMADGAALHLLANLTSAAQPAPRRPAGRLLFATHPDIRGAVARNELEPWSVTWLLERSRGEH